ncbi:MAG: purine-nucleoside phosphorylase [Bacteriovoracaceae bacterium]|jgi:purine-nucleoside phosphorylase|nr:purine-nucleoside phosphorylase [Bacteriovoracaceae bacterium]
MYEKLKQTCDFIKSKTSSVPKVGLVLGSGLGAYIQRIENQTILTYEELPNFLPCSVEGHEGRLILGTVDGVEVAVLQGRLHAYEGHSMEQIVFPVRVLATLGIEVLVLTNASGGINMDYSPGDLVLLSDHINLMGKNPLVGPNISELGPRFPDMTQAYSEEIIQIMKESATEIGLNIKTGIYCSLLGPTYETPAEIRMLKTIGADMVGMSTVPESIAGNHLGLKVCGISCITNMAAGIAKHKLNHDEVKEEALKVMETFSSLLTKSMKKIKDL